MELNQFINDIYNVRCNIFYEKIKARGRDFKSKDFEYIKKSILNILKKNYNKKLPIIVDDNSLTKLSDKISNDFTKHTISYFSVYELTNKFIRFLNIPLSEKNMREEYSNFVKTRIIKSNFLSNIEKISHKNIVEDYQPDKIKFFNHVLKLREFFNKNFPLEITDKEKSSENYLNNLQNAIIFSILVNSFITFNDIIDKVNLLTYEDINLKIGFLNFKNSENKEMRYFIDFFTIFLIKILILHLKLNKISKTKRAKIKIFNLNRKSFDNWLINLCNKIDIKEKITLTYLVKIAGSLSTFVFPPAIVALLKRKLHYTSFNFEIIERIQKKKYGNLDFKKITVSNLKKIKHFNKSEHRKDIVEEIKILHKIYTLLDKNKSYSFNKKIIEKFLKKINLNEFSFSFNLLIEWIFFNLSKKRRLKISTIKEYFSGFYKDFMEVTYEFSIYEFDEHEIEEIIEQLFLKRFFKIYYNRAESDNSTFEDINLNKTIEGKSVGKIKAKIKNFFMFYKEMYDKNLTDDIFYPLEFYRSKSSVRTSLITPAEFQLFLDSLKHERKEYIEIISGLAFYGGLRKSEIFNLKFKDIVFGVEDYIFIQKSKTYSGIRKVPIYYLFPESFLNKFKKFYENSFKSLDEFHKNRKKNFIYNLKLFDNKRYDKEHFTQDINFIILCLKSFFKDNKLVFHSLRHCFGSWLILMFFIVTKPNFKKYLKKFFEDNYIAGLIYYNLKKIEEFFLSKNLKYQDLNAVGLWKISMVMGHISPEETLSSYIHVLELFAGYFYWVNSQNSDRLYKYYGKFNAKRIICLIPSLNNDRSVRKAKFTKTKNSYSIYSIMKYLDKKLKINSIF